ncbi:tetratricopeptide repeat protein [Nannocystaceae bacterium ST9]
MSDDLDFMPAEPSAKPKAEPSAAPKTQAPTKPAEAKSAEAKPATTAETETDQRVELPTWNRARRKRQANVRAAEQEDAFQRGVRMAGRQAIDFPKLVIGGIVIGVIAIAAAVVLGQKSSSDNAEATRVLATATTAIVRGQVVPAESQVGLEDKIARMRFPVHATEDEREQAVSAAIDAALAVDREDVAIDARLVAAAHQVRIGQFAAALEHYDAFLAEVDDDHPLRFLAFEGKGIAQEAEADYEGALASFQQIAPHPSDFYRHMALYHQGRVLEALDRKDDAIAIYEQFFAEFPPTQPVMPTSMVRERIEKLDPEFAARMAAAEPAFDSTDLAEFPVPPP